MMVCVLSRGALGAAALETSAVPPVQLVQSIPLETSLEQTGILNTAEVWIELASKAKSTLDLAQFYVSAEPKPGKDKATPSPDKRLLNSVVDELEKAAKRGVKIRLLLSQALLNEDPRTLERFKKMEGATVRTFDLSKMTGGVLHSKYWIVDRKKVFLGSQNFDWRALIHTHELGVLVNDLEIAKQMTRVFDLDWKIARTHQFPEEETFNTIPVLASNTSKTLELFASPQSLNPPDIRSSIQALLEILNQAKKSLKIQLLDYSPVTSTQIYWPDLDDALRAAALRGLKVQLLVGNGSTTLRALDYLKSLSLIPNIEVKMATIPAYSGGQIPFARMIHSKYMVVDDEALWIGTSNWSKGYFYNSRNVELFIKKPEIANSAGLIFQKLWNSQYSEKIEINKIKKPI
jgi:phosphatidylserine/phosphatidylglycerophosphate/cardiolipin synthase-like enzyme